MIFLNNLFHASIEEEDHVRDKAIVCSCLWYTNVNNAKK